MVGMIEPPAASCEYGDRRDAPPRAWTGRQAVARALGLGFAWALALQCPAAGAADQPAPAARADLVLPQARWTSLPKDVHRVAFAPDGSPWFIADAPAAGHCSASAQANPRPSAR
ncbi:MAG: hypothetical protein ACKOSQ_11210, partial [Planctomycetaceae bacterium]